MKTLLAALGLALLSTSTMAGSLPIKGTYGTPMGCAVALGKDSSGNPETILYVTATQLYGMERGCQIGEVKGSHVSLSCDGEGEHFSSSAVFSISGDKLIWREKHAAPVSLHACQ